MGVRNRREQETKENRMSENKNPESPSYKNAFDAERPRIDGLEPSEVVHDPGIEASSAGALAEASAEKVLDHREELVAKFGPESGERADRLESVARATQHAAFEEHRVKRSGDLSALAEETKEHHKVLFTTLSAVVALGLGDERELAQGSDLQGYEEIGRSTLVLVSFARANWEVVQANSGLTEAKVNEAEASAIRLRTAVTRRDHKANVAKATQTKVRALSLLIGDYEEVRREMAYLRWYDDDVDEIIPSLWSRKGRSARSEREETTDTNASQDSASGPVTPGPTDGGPFTP
jgi:hypothetical protein